MKDIIPFMDAHPYISLFMLWAICQSAATILVKPIALVVRHLNIRKAGWPPAHCDADGDIHEERKTQ